MTDPTPEALVIELEAQKIADAVCDNYGIRKHSLEWAMCKASALQALRTGQLAPVQQPSGDVVEAVARAIHGAKMPGHNPDCLYEHHDYEPWPVDDRREYADPFTGKPRVQLFHKAWRRYESAATAAITAYEAVSGVAKMREDAARYRWLRDVSCPPHNFYISVPDEFHGVKYGPDEVDAYIDAARAALGEKP